MTDTPPSTAAAPPDHAARAARHLAARDDARRVAGRIGAARLLAALAAVAVLAVPTARWPLAPALRPLLAGALGVAFVALVVAHRRARAREDAAAARHRVAVRAGARARRDWDALPVPAWPAPADGGLPPRVGDLHLTGRASLTQLLDVVTPMLGGARLLAWLLADPPPADALRARQAAVRALAARPAFLEGCAADADAARPVSPRALDALVRWATAPTDGRAGPLARLGTWAGPAVTGVALALAWGGVAPLEGTLGAALVVNLVLAGAAQRPLRPLLAQVADVPRLIAPVLALMARVDAEAVDAPAWAAVRARLRRADGVAAVRRLGRLLAWAEVRYSPLAHWALNALLAWDAALLARLERWRRAAGAHVPAWLDGLADGEALVALATLAHEHPDWAFPVPDDDGDAADGPALAADGLAHPLLPPAGRVGNPARLGGAGRVLIVTGSNMAGKTTLLRAVGTNVLLAQAGGPVCAAAMRWRRARVRTSVRVHDELAAGVSLFLAELRRLKGIVDDAALPAGTPVLYLLDEVLHGTNSDDRRVATRAVLARLAAHDAVGLVTTHDLALADDPALAPAATHVHFRERYVPGDDGPRMAFDYVARPGPATGANALALLAALGLGPPAGEG